jgi:phosphotransferase system  glucose/maltose/N-acetylglucosamine-specific IIC component
MVLPALGAGIRPDEFVMRPGVWRAAFAERVLTRMKIVGKIIVTVVALLVAIAIASTCFEFFFGNRYSALIIITALVIVSPVVFLLWRDKLT